MVLWSHFASRQTPKYGSRECIVVMAATCTIDPSDIFQTIANIKLAHIRCSVISLGAEVFVAKKLTQETAGLCVGIEK